MQYYVRELNDRRALLIAEDGYPLSLCACVDDAVATSIIHCRVAPLWIEWHEEHSVQGVDGDDVRQALAWHCKPKAFPVSTQLAACG